MLRELIAANEADRQAVFAARRVEIIEDCCACLEEVTSAELIDLAAKLGEALELAEAGRHLSAAQALAASVFDTVLRRTIKPQRIAGYYGKAKGSRTATRPPRWSSCDGASCTCRSSSP